MTDDDNTVFVVRRSDVHIHSVVCTIVAVYKDGEAAAVYCATMNARVGVTVTSKYTYIAFELS